MTVFPSKSEFLRLGAQTITPSTSHASQDCFVCKGPLSVHPHTTTPTCTSHPALRITACSHILGIECLSAWLDVSNTCPICSRMLFYASRQTVTQEDVDAIIRLLSPMYSERRIMSVLAWRMKKQGEGETMLRQKNEEHRRKEVREESERRNAYTMKDEDWLDSDEELDVGGDEDSEFDADEFFGVDEEDEEDEVVVD